MKERRIVIESELDTQVDEILESSRELCGWFWAHNDAAKEGWVPLKTTRSFDV